jgi:AraC family transcriptional regulator, regulatory protein of adaptative response / DNA-3-methyladenine glycosylase II
MTRVVFAGRVHEDFDACYRACQARDPRFDGWIYAGVTSTGIYCRPSCPATTPKPSNMRFYPTAAAAQHAGFRACRRCRPDASPGSPEWDTRADVVARAMRGIADGVVDREGVEGLAGRLGYSARQLERLVRAELGTGPLAIARAQRGQTARVLIETTDLDFSAIAFAAGFSSIRQFNDTIRHIFALTPTEMRGRRRRADAAVAASLPGGGAPQAIRVRLAHRLPYSADGVLAHLALTAVPGVEEFDHETMTYRRTLRLPHGPGIVALTPQDDHVEGTLRLDDLRDLPAAVARARWLLDLDADPVAVDAHLSEEPALRRVIARDPGRRVPRSPDGGELALRAVLGQQVSTAAAARHTARLVEQVGDPLESPDRGLTHVFPTPEAVASAPDYCLRMPERRRCTVRGVATLLARGELRLEPDADREEATARLDAVPGVGPWTISVIAMRALGDPDAFLPDDLGVRRAAAQLGFGETGRGLAERAARWRPWRAYATQYLWAALDHPVATLRRHA